MSFKRYYNEESVMGVSPVFGEDFSPEINQYVEKVSVPLMLNDVAGEYLGYLKIPTSQEIHIYASDNLLKSSYNSPIKYNANGAYPIIKISPEYDLRSMGVLQGAYSINYNFLNKFVKDCKIKEINGDRTEIRISKKGSTKLSSKNAFSDLKDILTSNNALNSFTAQNTIPDFVMNFKDNILYNVVNLKFEGPSNGEVTQTLSYPKDVYNGNSTTFIPIDAGVENLNVWRLFVEVYTPAIGESISTTLPTGEVVSLAGKPTNRARKYLLKYQSTTNNLVWQPGSVTYTSSNLPEEVDNDGSVVLSNNVDLTNLKLTYKKWDSGISSFDTLVLKLDKPLDFAYGINSTFDLDGRIYKSYIEKIIAFPSVDDVDRPDFSEPNFNMDMSDYKGAVGTNWQTWNSLLDVNPTTSQQLVSYYFSGSLGDVKLNIDYSDFANYIHFSSATERVDNFVYKLQQIENYNNRIDLLSGVSGSEAITNISQSIVRRDNLIGGFDEFENYLYYGSGSTNYTHWSSSAYIIEPYPKVSTFPHILYPSTSSHGEEWYAGVYESASLYDNFNDARLRNMIPIHLQEDERNIEYVTLIDMIGQHFDIQWTYIKSLTDINRREEHPKDGMADNLLKDVADSMGWYLSNGYSDVSLWKYALGTEEDGTLFTTGSLESKSRQQIVHETWRRIVNTLPMLYKTKGTAPSIKTILATYGIPQAFLKIREWGGPTVSTSKNVFEHERFVNKLELSPSKYLTAPWDDINSDRPNSIEVIGKMPKGDFHILRLSDGSNYLDYFWDYEDNQTARIRLSMNGTDVTASDYVPYKQRRDGVFLLSSGSVEIKSAWVDDWGYVLANPTASVASPGSTFNTIWNSTGTLQVPGPTTDTNVYNFETASIQEVRYFRDIISNEIVTEHAKNREAYFSDDNTTDLDIDTSFDKLMFRVFPDSRLNSVSSSIVSMHPNQKITETDSGLIMSASLVNVTPTQLVGEVDTQFVTIPSMGALNLMNNKIRIESASLKGQLNPDKSNELSEFDYAPLDSNLLGTYFTTTDTVNFDIYASEGYFEADDWVGDPDKRYNEDYPLLKYRAKNYFQKYTASTAIDLILDMLSRYDMSVFTQIQQLLPARVDWHKGILIEPHILERNKYRRNRNIEISKHHYAGSVHGVLNSISASRHDLNQFGIDLFDYQSSVYQYDIATMSSSLVCTTPTSTYVTSSTTLNGRIGAMATDYLSYNSTNYLISNRVSNTIVQINSSLPAISSQTGTIYYTGSYDFNGQSITASREVQVQVETPISASITNRTDEVGGTFKFELDNFTPAVNSTPVKTIIDFQTYAGPITISEVDPIGYLGDQYTLEPISIEYNAGGGYYEVNIQPGAIMIEPMPAGTQFFISYMSESISTQVLSSNLVHKYSGAPWPLDVAEYGSIVFDDGNGDDKTYPILERISSVEIKIDTSSHAPNTSGSAVSSDTQYSSSAQQNITFTIGDPSLITCVSESTYVNRTNGYWQYSPTGSTVLKHKSSKIYQVPKYFYSTPYSASINSPSSSSMDWWEGQDDRLPLSIENLFYNGCRITSDSLTTNSPDTPDGGPVVEITRVDPNILVYSTQGAVDGNITSGDNVSPAKPIKIMPMDVLIGSKTKTNVVQKPNVSLENLAMKPLPFIPSISNPKLPIIQDKQKAVRKLIDKLLKRK